MKIILRSVIPVLALAAAGCTSGTEPDGPYLGYIVTGPDGAVDATVPDTVRAAEPFEVSIRTVGRDGCTHEESTRVKYVTAHVVEVRPFDTDVSGDGALCTYAEVFPDHHAELTLQARGRAEIRFYGRGAGALTRVETRTVVVE